MERYVFLKIRTNTQRDTHTQHPDIVILFMLSLNNPTMLFIVPIHHYQTCPGLEQYAIKKFAEAFEALPMAIAENTGIKVCV